MPSISNGDIGVNSMYDGENKVGNRLIYNM